MGLIGYYIFFALKGGTTYGFSPVDFIQRPALWLETISEVSRHRVVRAELRLRVLPAAGEGAGGDAGASRPELPAVSDDRRRAGARQRLP